MRLDALNATATVPTAATITAAADFSALKPSLVQRFLAAKASSNVKKRKIDALGSASLDSHRDLVSVLCSGADVLLPFQAQSMDNAVRESYSLYALNAVLKALTTVNRHNLKIARANDEEDEEGSSGSNVDSNPDHSNLKDSNRNTTSDLSDSDNIREYRDQGFTRPKVLILAPFKNIAYDVINHIIAFSGASQIENKSRFIEEFTLPPEEDVLDTSKPLDHQYDFRGNIDDMFRIGIKFSSASGRHLKLFSDFYSSDIIVASPLGLRMVIGAEGDKSRDYDFLSSISLVILDRADMFHMQNWDHVTHTFMHTNKTPKSSHNCDFSRIYTHHLNGQSSQHRQTVILTQHATPEINSLLSKHCHNRKGVIKLKSTSVEKPAIQSIVTTTRQIFTRFTPTSITDAAETRFQHFTGQVEKEMRNIQNGTLIFIPSYFDHVRVKAWLHAQNAVFTEICEYTTPANTSRARSDFYHGKVPVLVITERFLFFRRYVIRGVKRVWVYQVPEYARLYAEVVGMVEEGGDARVWYCGYDFLRMGRIVGEERAGRMCRGEKDTYMFV